MFIHTSSDKLKYFLNVFFFAFKIWFSRYSIELEFIFALYYFSLTSTSILLGTRSFSKKRKIKITSWLNVYWIESSQDANYAINNNGKTTWSDSDWISLWKSIQSFIKNTERTTQKLNRKLIIKNKMTEKMIFVNCD